jgi:hypothetical protein
MLASSCRQVIEHIDFLDRYIAALTTEVTVTNGALYDDPGDRFCDLGTTPLSRRDGFSA